MENRTEGISFVKTLLATFIIVNLALMLLFADYIKVQDRARTQENAEINIARVLEGSAENLYSNLKNVQDSTENVAEWMEEYLKEPSHTRLSSEYIKTEKGTVVRSRGGISETDILANSRSNVFVAKGLIDKKNVKEDINYTERLDRHFENLLTKENLVIWVYIVTDTNVLRVSPYKSKYSFDEEHDQRTDVFYENVLESNKKNGGKWSEPYEDYLGSGMVITYSVPVYNRDGSIYGVLCSDINLGKLREELFSKNKLNTNEQVMLLDAKGGIVYHSQYINRELEKGNTLNVNIFSENMTESAEETLKLALEKDGFYEAFNEGNKTYYSSMRIKNTSLIMIMAIEKEDYLQSMNLDSKIFSWFMIVNLIAMGFLVVFLYRKFSIPMNHLSTRARLIAEGDFTDDTEDDKRSIFTELNELATAFDVMNKSLDETLEGLKSKNIQINSIINTVKEALIVIDKNGIIIELNKSATDMYNKLKVGNTYNIYSHEEEIMINTCFEKKREGNLKIVEEERVYNNFYYPIVGEGENVSEVLIFSENYSEQLVMEQNLQQSEKMAGIGQIATSIAHELKNPLAVIKGSTYLLKFRAHEDIRDEINSIDQAICESERVIETILDFSGIKKNQVEVDLRKLTDEIALLTKKERTRKGIIILSEINVDAFNFGEAVETIKLVLQNLVLNAVQAIDGPGTIRITAEEDGDFIDVKVSDNGPGISQNPKDKVFQAFETTKGQQGTGIGLWLCKKMVEKLEGNIFINEKNREETEFVVKFPRCIKNEK